MKRLLILGTLALCSCAPLVQTVQGERGSLTRDGNAVVLTNPGPGDMTETVMRVEGPGLTLGAPCEVRAVGVYGCLIGTLPEGKKYRVVPLTGTISKAAANLYRAGSDLFHRIELP